MGAGTTPRRRQAASWQRYRLIADNSSDVVYQTTPDGVISWIAPTVEALLGYRPSELIGVEARSLVHPDDLPMVNRLRVTVYDGAELDEIPCRFRTTTGTYRTCMVRARAVHDDSGAVIGAVMALRDSHVQAAALRALATLSHANAVLVQATDEDELLQAMCETVTDSGRYLVAWYGRKVDDDAKSIAQVAKAGPEVSVLDGATASWGDQAETGIVGPAIRDGRVKVVNGMAEDPRVAHVRDVTAQHHIRSGIALPVRVHGAVDGALVVYSDEIGVFDDLAQSLLEELTTDIGLGIERLRATREIAEAAQSTLEQQARLRGVLDAMLDPLVVLDAIRDERGRVVDMRYVDANAAALRYDGLTRDELIGRRWLEVHPTLLEHGPGQLYFDAIDSGEPVALDDYAYDNPLVHQGQRRYDIRAARTGDGIALTWRDVTDRYLAQQRTLRSEARYRLLAENISDVLWETREDGTIGWVSESVTRVLGWRPDDLIGLESTDLIHPDERERAARNREVVATGMSVHDEFRVRAADGGYRWFALTAQREQGTGPRMRVVSLRDIHDEVAGRERLEHAVRHDPLTGLVTRAVAVRRLQRALDDDQSGIVAVLKLGVDGLARVNESLGHAAGDVVLAAVAARVVDAVGDYDQVARGTGDELIVLLTGLTSASVAGDLADRLRQAVRGAVALDGHDVLPTVCVGVATSESLTEGSAERMLAAAGIAMRDAKAGGGDRTLFVDPALAEAATRRLTLEIELRQAIPAGELRPWFQPVVTLTDGRVIGYEALVRWIRPDGERRQPDDFLPIAERTALVVELDKSVLDQSLAILRTLPDDQNVAVNVSPASLLRHDYVEHVVAAIDKAGVRPGRLILEITETALLDGMEAVREHMRLIAAHGVRWYVDDFGTGYSSIAHLRDLPVAGIKLDRSFTMGIGEGDATCIRLAQALAGLAQGLQLATVAEGVETEEEAAYLLAQGWEHAQGWLYGAAAPLAD